MVAASGAALAQVPDREATQDDVSHEFKDTPPDPNGLPPADPTVPEVILDSHAYAGGVANVPVNEWIMPELFPDGHGGRTRDILVPGLTRLNAMYGEWQDKDLDGVILFTNDSDPNNEWTLDGLEPSEDNVTQGMRAYIYPGYRPDAFSDCYILAYKYLGADFCQPNEEVSDLDYSYIGGGEWRNSWLLMDDDGSLLKEVEVHTVANGLDTSAAPGYQCAIIEDDPAPCLVDIDEYDVLDSNVAQLYDVVTTVLAPHLAHLDPVVGAVQDVGMDAIGGEYTKPIFRDEANEADPTGPHPSMLDADYTGGAHAYLDIVGAGYWSAPGALTLAWSTFGAVPDAGDAQGYGKGFAPHTFSFMGYLYVWHDADGDLEIDSSTEYFKGLCEVKDADGRARTAFNVTVEPVDDNGNPTTWGTTGVYVFRNEGDTVDAGGETAGFSYLDESVTDALDFRLDQYAVAGPIVLNLGCDTSDPGDFFPDDFLVFPEGTNGFRVRATSDVLSVTFGDPFAGGTATEHVQDVDIIDRWN